MYFGIYILKNSAISAHFTNFTFKKVLLLTVYALKQVVVAFQEKHAIK